MTTYSPNEQHHLLILSIWFTSNPFKKINRRLFVLVRFVVACFFFASANTKIVHCLTIQYLTLWHFSSKRNYLYRHTLEFVCIQIWHRCSDWGVLIRNNNNKKQNDYIPIAMCGISSFVEKLFTFQNDSIWLNDFSCLALHQFYLVKVSFFFFFCRQQS